MLMDRKEWKSNFLLAQRHLTLLLEGVVGVMVLDHYK